MTISPQDALTQFQANTTTGYQPGSAPSGYQGGVVPITNVPLHQFERDALIGLSDATHGGLLEQAREMAAQQGRDPQGTAARYTAPGVQDALNSMNSAIGRGSSAFTGADVEQYFNPYQKYIEDRLTDEGAKARARLMGDQGRGGTRGAFGSTAFGTALGGLEEDLNRNLGELLYRGYSDAQALAQNQKNRELQGAQLYGDRAGIGQDVFGSALGYGRQATQDLFNQANQYQTGRTQALQGRLGAGQYIRDFNERQANQLNSEINRRINMTPDRIGFTANTLQTFPRAQQSPTGQVGSNTLSQIGGIGMSAGSLIDQLGGLF